MSRRCVALLVLAPCALSFPHIPLEGDGLTASKWLLQNQDMHAQLMHQREAANEFAMLQTGLKMDAEFTQHAYFEVSIGGRAAGRIVLGLFGDSAEDGELVGLVLGEVERGGKRMWYQGSSFHRIIPNFMIQGGDFTRHDGSGGDSIWGGTFQDENFVLKHDTEGTLSMANYGKDTNKGQFFITTKPTPHLDGKHVVFGRVTAGMDVVRAVEKVGSRQGTPREKVVIEECGLEAPTASSTRTCSTTSWATRAPRRPSWHAVDLRTRSWRTTRGRQHFREQSVNARLAAGAADHRHPVVAAALLGRTSRRDR